MALRHRFWPAGLLFSMAFATVCITCTLRTARAEGTPAPPPEFKEQPVFQLVAVKYRPTLYEAANGGGMQVAEPNYLITAAPVGAKKAQSVVLMEKGADEIISMLKAAKPGDFITMAVKQQFNNTYVTSLSKYNLQIGEDQPNVFLYAGLGETDKNMALKLYKLGALGRAEIPNDKTNLKDIAGHLNPGDPIEIHGVPERGSITVTALALYFAPVVAKITEITQSPMGEEQTPAITIAVGDDSKTICVPGKNNSKGHFIPDTPLAATVKGLEVGQTVRIVYVSDGQTLWLRSVGRQSTPPRLNN